MRYVIILRFLKYIFFQNFFFLSLPHDIFKFFKVFFCFHLHLKMNWKAQYWGI